MMPERLEQKISSSTQAVDVGEAVRSATGLRVWLADLTYTQQTIAADVMPAAIGGIATFTETRLTFDQPIRLFKYPEKLAAALNEDGIPDIIGFSNYIWNSSLSYAFARAIKQRSPQTVIVFGGPNYPIERSEQETFLRARPDGDFYIVKEGELAFSNIIAALLETGFDVDQVKKRALGSIHAISADGTVYLSDVVDRIRDLTAIPSPYATGRLDEFFDGMLLPIMQTNRGCPFACTFCVEGVKYYNKIYRSSAEKVQAELDYIGNKMAELRRKGGRNDLFIADSNFGMYREDIGTCREIARVRSAYGWPEYINVATGKNQKERVLEASRLIDGALRLSGSVQSLDKDVLANIKRDNISADGLMDLALSAKEIGANSYSEIILGLPGDSRSAHYYTVKTVMDAGFTNIYLFQLMLLPGTDMCTPETREKFRMVSKFRVLPRCYGHFDVLDSRAVAAEIEEICVAGRNLSFEDYLACRKLHLIVTIFHNDGIFGSLLTLLRSLNISVFRWMELLVATPLEGGLKRLVDDFLRETKDELWDSREELETFINQPGIVEKFISGELGNNLLFVYKTRAITEHVRELAELARTTIYDCLTEAGHGEEIFEFVDDAIAYHTGRMSNLFVNHDDEPRAKLRYDIQAFEEDRRPSTPRDYRLPAPQPYRFVLEDSQRELVERYLGIYGSSPVGIGRILSKIYIRRLYRHAIAREGALARQSEFAYRIAGLQN